MSTVGLLHAMRRCCIVQTWREVCDSAQVGLMIDLTNSWRYYELEEVTDLGITHLKIKCRGRGEVRCTVFFGIADVTLLLALCALFECGVEALVLLAFRLQWNQNGRKV